ncbi:MAG: DUF87 domain-containing protein [Streptosporangiales bacterium]|nr:DUF87 domain-containing protein [Streptosporangiales bacterium]
MSIEALRALKFDWTLSQQDVWASSPYHVDGLHPACSDLIRRCIGEARFSAGSNPLGIALQGERGVGKTHLLGWTRRETERAGGYFFLVGISSGKAFWDEVLGAIREQLQPPAGDGPSQLARLLDDLARRAGLDAPVREAVSGRSTPTRADLDAFITGLRELDRSTGLNCQDTARALVLLASPAQEHQDVGHYFLSGDELEPEERRAWGIRRLAGKDHRSLITELSSLLALSGPTVVAVDQIDALIDEIGRADETAAPGHERLVTQVSGGLMALRDMTRRTLTIVSCLPESWAFIKQHAVDTVTDRFRRALQLRNIPSAGVGRELVEKRFAAAYEGIGFQPPYPSWPIRPGAFEDAENYTARGLLKLIENHVNACVRDGEVRELDRLDEWTEGESPHTPATLEPRVPDVPEEDLAALDARFAELRAAADVSQVFDAKTEDATVPALLTAGIEAWIKEHGEPQGLFRLDPPPSRKPALHARLRQTLDEHTERERQWSFRAIGADSAKAVLNRLRVAVAESGLDGQNPDRRLFVLRNTNWPTGPTTTKETTAFEKNGGVAFPVTGDDLRTFSALRRMLAEDDPRLESWLAVRRPAHSTELFARALDDVVRATPASHQPKPAEPADAAPVGAIIRVGTTVVGSSPAFLDVPALRKHTVIFAGAGSGKTVLLRRTVEECALHGISAIVLDPNNDLARLGDPWPEPPGSWIGDDAERARRYMDETDVVVWTPRRQGGRPLVFQPLPVFADILDNDDEFHAAVDAAVDALAPRVNADKRTDKANLERAVLTGALRYFGREGGGGLGDFIALLAALPDGASTLIKAPKVAADLAEKLEAARVTDPLFGGAGQAADPGVLLTPPPGKRARVSVISMIGLPTEGQRQSFVNQLQMALFSWVKRHPAPSETPSGLLVMDEAQTLVPAVGTTVCTQSTIQLSQQARKYGLALVFATQSPKGLHNQIANNAVSQFFGRLNSGTQIDVARDLARNKGGDVPDISRLSTGEFYLATEGRGFRKLHASLCLSHHPPSPLTTEEVLTRARRQ